jgi:hypothetical protein
VVKNIPVDLYRLEVSYVAKPILSDKSCLAIQARELRGLGERNPGEAKGAAAAWGPGHRKMPRALGLQTKLCITTTLPTLLQSTTRRASSSRSVNSTVMPTAHSNPGLILTRDQSCEAAADLGIRNSHDLAQRSAYDLQEPPDTATTRSCA